MMTLLSIGVAAAASLGATMVGHAQAGPFAIKAFQFVYGSQIYQSGSAFEVLAGTQGRFEFGVYTTTGQPIANVQWRITSDQGFDSGIQTASSIVPGPGAWSQLQLPWTFVEGTHKFTATVLGQRGLVRPGIRGTSASFTLTSVFVVVQPLQPAAVGLPAAALAITQVQDPTGHCTTDPPTVGASDIRLVIRSTSPVPAGFTGCALIADLFKGVQLGNGWQVKRASFSTTSSSAQPVWEVEPSGSSLAGRLRMRVAASYPYGYTTTVRIDLKGPPGTQPQFILSALKIQ
jgi:hypothetical protein